MLSGILGTKEYRKPEWVTQMEELKAALKGNEPSTNDVSGPVCLSIASMSPDPSEHEMSADSLDACSRTRLDGVRPNRRLGGRAASSSWASLGDLSMGSDSVFLSTASSCSGESHVPPHVPFRLNPLVSEVGESNAHVCSTGSESASSPEPDEGSALSGDTRKSTPQEVESETPKDDPDFDDTEETLGFGTAGCKDNQLLDVEPPSDDNTQESRDSFSEYDTPSCSSGDNSSFQDVADRDDLPMILDYGRFTSAVSPDWEELNQSYFEIGSTLELSPNGFEDGAETDDCHQYYLSPIIESSEPATSGSGSNSPKDDDITSTNYSNVGRHLSSSCEALASHPEIFDQHIRYQTFPRSRVTPLQRFGEVMSVHPCTRRTLYPLEPRELDPSSFQQLHTVDSCDELQEFLLLESQCMSSDKSGGLASAFITQHSSESGD